MKEASLPSPGVGSKSYHMRRLMANYISQLEVSARAYPNQANPNAADFLTFLDAARAAAATTGKAAPAMTFAGAGGSTTIVGTATNQTTLNKGGSSGAVAYTSSNPAVATVNSSGLVTGVAEGETTITATMAEGTAHKPASRSLVFTVTDG